MQRYNIFNNIHKGLRAVIYRTAEKLQQTDFLLEEEAEEALDRVREVIMLIDGHSRKENQFILPVIDAYEPSVADSFKSEYEKDLELSRQIERLIGNFASADSLDEKVKAGQEISSQFVAFTIFNLQLMAKEEDLLNKILWRYYSDAELVDISDQIIASTPPWINEFYSAWMLRGLNTRETISWLKAVEEKSPGVVYQDLIAASKRELSTSRFQRIQRALAGTEVLG